jgi:3-oxoadipate enol-lactonase
MANATIEGIGISYHERGSGFPLLLAHGLVATKHMWDEHLGAFSQRYRIVAYDIRGHGESDAPPVDDAGYTMDQLVEDQKALMDHLGIEEAYIGGLSLGGMIAMRFALRYPRSTRALLLCDTSPGMGTEGMWSKNRAVLEPLVRSQGVAAVMRGLYSQGAKAMNVSRHGKEIPPGIVAHIERLAQMTADGFLGVSRAAGDAPSVLERLHEIEAPTLILTGDRDFFRDASLAMERRLPNATYVEISDSWHGTCLWQPEQFRRAVLNFLSSVEAG